VVGLVIGLVVAVVGVAVALALAGAGHSPGKNAASSVRNALGLGGSYRLYGRAVAVSADPGQTDVYVDAPPLGKSVVVLRRVDPVHGRVVWSTPDLGAFDNTQTIVAGPTAAYAVTGTTVTAFDGATGRRLWEASLSYALASPCAGGCAAFVGGHLVTLSKDGTVQSFDGATGRQAWSNRMHSTPRFLEPAGGLVAVDDTAGGPSDHVLVLFDPATGASRTIAPVCAKDPATPFSPARPESEDDWFLSPDGTGLTVLMATIDGCAMHYTLGDGKVTWQDPPAQHNKQLPSSWTGSSAAAGPSAAVWTTDEGQGQTVYAVDLASGAVRKLLHDDRNRFKVAGIVDGVVALEAAPSFDSAKPQTWGVDLATGKPLWQLAYQGGSGSDDQNVSVTATAVLVAVCHSDAKQCAFKALDPKAGTVNGTSTVGAGLIPRIDALTRAPQSVLVVADGHLVVLDPTSAAVKGHFS
jgi:outer membrane protein assembly factor BamB